MPENSVVDLHRHEIQLTYDYIEKYKKAKQDMKWQAPLGVIVVSAITFLFSPILALLVFGIASWLAVKIISNGNKNLDEGIQGGYLEIERREAEVAKLLSQSS